jgi:hypothetical protein
MGSLDGRCLIKRHGNQRFALVKACVEPPAGIEPATPSLPSMVGPFGGQHGTSFRSVELQVAGLIDEREMGCCEAVCGTAAGKSLARMQIIRGLEGQVEHTYVAKRTGRPSAARGAVAYDAPSVDQPLGRVTVTDVKAVATSPSPSGAVSVMTCSPSVVRRSATSTNP